MGVRKVLVWMAGLILLTCVSAFAEDSRPILEYYYENYCESCHPDQDFAAEFSALTADSIENWDYRAYNVVQRYGETAYDEMRTRLGLSRGETSFPVVVLEDHAFIGSAEIYEKLPEYVVRQWLSRDSVLYCLNLQSDATGEVQAMLRALPDRISVTLGRYTFESQIKIVEIQGDSQALGDAPSSAEPTILAGSSAYVGKAEIERLLEFRLSKGAALNPQFSEQNASDSSHSEGRPIAVLSGIALLVLALLAGQFVRSKKRKS